MKSHWLILLFAALLAYPAGAGQAIAIDDPVLDFGQVAPTVGTVQRTTELCTGLTRGGPYSVRGTGSSTLGGFALDSGSYSLDYHVHYTATAGRPGRRELLPNTVESGFIARPPRGPHGCSDAELSVTLQATDLAAAPGGRYTGLLLLTIIPE